MSFSVNFGSGIHGTPTLDTTPINSYARITAITPNSATINLQAASIGTYGKFAAGNEILFQVSASTGSTYTQYLGAWALAKIISVNENVLMLDSDLTAIIPASEVAHYYVQAVAIAQFENLTLETGTTLRPPNYSTTNFYGGILALKVSDTLTFNGGHIDLSDAGIPIASKNLRPVMPLETYAVKDTDKYAGWENFATKNNFTLQAGDGAVFIAAKNFICNSTSRIGNINSHGAQFCRGATDSVGVKPANITNVGGSTIFIAAENISDFTPSIISKYRSGTAGQGICRCYIATNSTLPNDEGLYAFDTLNDSARVMKSFNVRDFGDGSLGDLNEPAIQLNNYARITAISTDRKKISYTAKTTAGLAQITTGALVMIHLNHKDKTAVALAGRFILAKILSDNGSEILLNTTLPDDFDCNVYAAQIVSVAQANNFTLTKENKATPKFDGKIGGILALAVKNSCNLTGKLNVELKGGGSAYGAEGLKVLSNTSLRDKLPIGQGHGSVFLLAKSLTLDTNSRIGATYSGAGFTSYKGADGSGKRKGGGGSAANGGTQADKHTGGYGSNARDGAAQGAHVLIIADTINNFTINAISTGGNCGTQGKNQSGKPSSGGAGYGGSGKSSASSHGGYSSGGKGGFHGL